MDCRPAVPADPALCTASVSASADASGAEFRSLLRLPIAPCAASRGPADRHSLPELEAPAARPAGRAASSPCGRYRWWLTRLWQPRGPRLVFLGLNPSRANGERDDPTLRRLLDFAHDGGYGGVEVLNLFARISPSPTGLRRCGDPVGERCDAWIRRRLGSLAHHDAPVSLWLGWGNGGSWRGRDAAVLALLVREGWRPLCRGRTRSGQPRHPLYQSRREPLVAFAPSCGKDLLPPVAPLPWPAFPVATPST
jgi:hypothetical protein